MANEQVAVECPHCGHDALRARATDGLCVAGSCNCQHAAWNAQAQVATDEEIAADEQIALYLEVPEDPGLRVSRPFALSLIARVRADARRIAELERANELLRESREHHRWCADCAETCGSCHACQRLDEELR